MKIRIALLIALVSLNPGKDHYDPTTLVYPSFLHTMGIRKATKFHLLLYTKNKVKVRDPEGLAVVRLKSWDDPNSTKDDDEVTGYGVNSGLNMIVYNTSMTSLGFYGLKARGVKALNHPTAIAANEEGDVYVADTGNHRIVRFFNPGKQLKFVRAIGSFGAAPGQFNAPQGIALDTRGFVYVSDTNNHRVQILRPDGKLHLWFGKQGVQDGQLWHPTALAVADGGERWSYYKDSFIVLIDLDHTRIQKFTLDGRFLAAAKLKDIGFENGHLAYLALDYYNNIWVTDKLNHCIHKFDHNLNYLTSFGRKGKGDKEFMEPRGIAIYRRFGQVFVAEKESAQYYWIGTDIFDFQAQWLPQQNFIKLEFFLTEPSFLTLRIKNETEGWEKEIFSKKLYFSGKQKIYLRNQSGTNQTDRFQQSDRFANKIFSTIKSLKSGQYRITLKVEPTYSSYKYFSKEVESRVVVNP
ncbi:MAG: hypothetical protein D6813_06145 [Calditrichaeota bacterium]|nr:MAG: hypothetical protein D6813_06145 [Calditrichota bacterium]